MSRVTTTLLALSIPALLLGGCVGGVAPPAGATPAASAEPTIAPLPAGTYTTVNFQPAVTFTVPDGWILEADAPLYASLRPADNDLIGIHLFRDPLAASQDPSCPAAAEPGVAGTSSGLARWISERPGLSVTTPAMATIGGLPGLTIDVSLKPEWTQACPFANGAPSVALLNSKAIDHWVVVGNEQLRLYMLDLAGGGTLVVDVDAFDGALFDDLVARSVGVLRSMKVAPPPASAAPPASTTPSAPASAGPSAPGSTTPSAPASTAP